MTGFGDKNIKGVLNLLRNVFYYHIVSHPVCVKEAFPPILRNVFKKNVYENFLTPCLSVVC